MQLDKSIARIAFVVEKSLKKYFPDDYDKRCMYAAFGMHALAKKQKHDSIIVAGGFAALTVALDNSNAAYQGYNDGDGEFGHYWCEIDGHTVDLGPSFLPVSSRFPAANAPLVMWPLTKELPASLRYAPKIRYHTDVQPHMADDIMERLEGFLKVCDQKFAALHGQPKTKSWVLSGPIALSAAAKSGDLWASASERVQGMPRQDIPV